MAVSRVANSDTFKVSTPSEREIAHDPPLRRAAVSLVFDAMTKPEHVRRWWGCILGRQVTPSPSAKSTSASAAPGASLHRGPEGEYPAFYGVYQARSTRPERLVFTEIFEPVSPTADRS